MGIKSKECFYVIKDPRSFVITGDVASIIPTRLADEIVAVSFDNRSITLHETVNVDKKPFKVNNINLEIIDFKPSYELSVARLNKSSLFLLPMLGGTRRLFMYDKLFVNAYINVDQYETSNGLL